MTDKEFQELIDKVQADAEAHLERCEMELYGYDTDDDPLQLPGHAPVVEALGPFCGCTTCVVREVLHAAFEGLKRLLEDEVGTQTSHSR